MQVKLKVSRKKGKFLPLFFRAENSEDSADAAAVLEVVSAPKLVSGPRDSVAEAMGDIELRCQVKGRPKPNVQWYKNGDLIIESDYFQVKSKKNTIRRPLSNEDFSLSQIVRGTNLKILGLVELDSGVYQCVASNAVGNVQASAQLRVRPKGESAH